MENSSNKKNNNKKLETCAKKPKTLQNEIFETPLQMFNSHSPVRYYFNQKKKKERNICDCISIEERDSNCGKIGNFAVCALCDGFLNIHDL